MAGKKNKKKHSHRQGHPAHQRSKQQVRQTTGSPSSLEPASNAELTRLRKDPMLQWSLAGLIVLAAELILVLAGVKGGWVMPLGGTVWCLMVLGPIFMRRASGLGGWMLAASALFIALLVLSAPPSPPSGDTQNIASPGPGAVPPTQTAPSKGTSAPPVQVSPGKNPTKSPIKQQKP